VINAASNPKTENPQITRGHDSVLHGGNSALAKTNRDTVYLIGPWGSGAQVNGQFQTQSGEPDWNGWTHVDNTQETFSAKNSPTPFNPSTKIEFNLPSEGHLSLKIFNVRGELVKTLIDENREAGSGFTVWGGENGHGERVSSGVYFYEIRSHSEVKIGKMVLLK